MLVYRFAEILNNWTNLQGSAVMKGTGIMLVTCVGLFSEEGIIQKLITGVGQEEVCIGPVSFYFGHHLLCTIPHYAQSLTMHNPSLCTIPHYAQPLTMDNPSLWTIPHYAQSLTMNNPSLWTIPHYG